MIDTRLITQCESVMAITGNLTEAAFGFCSDTRHYTHPSMFMAFPGAKYNPLEFVRPLLEKGCPIVIYQKNVANEEIIRELKEQYPDRVYVGVRDAVSFTQELGSLHVKNWRDMGGQVFAISGSNGKTTHKEMLAFLLKSVMPNEVVATEKNNNNHLGVPLTVLQIKPETKVCVLELGSNHPGEIKVLCDLAKPNCGLVTNIGATHLEFFGTESAVFEEEGYLYYAVGDGLFFQNMDDPFLATLPRQPRTITFSANKSADIMYKVEVGSVQISGKLGDQTLSNDALTGAHNLTNMATSWVIATTLFPSRRAELVVAAAKFKPTPNRSEWKEFQGKKIYLDAYNANPSSMKVALTGFFDWLSAQKIPESSAVVVLGDMNELGETAPQYHREVGEFLKQWKAAKIVFIGRYATHYIDGLGGGTSYSEANQFKGSEWDTMTRGRTHVLIKGSRSLQLESLLAIT